MTLICEDRTYEFSISEEFNLWPVSQEGASRVLIVKLSLTVAPVIISGQRATGKELFARAIQEGSLRKQSPFIKVNCADLNENLLERKLLDHVEEVV